jgi:hypothetical protein
VDVVSEDPGVSVDRYCRDLESYLCRKNDGHLIRIVGPAFEQVCGWAARGVPLTVACRGIDRYFERYYAKGRRRRPVRIEFCEADVFDVFDEWRRAVGITVEAAGAPPEEGGDESARRLGSLPAHLERVVARLTALRAGEDRSLDATADALVRELDTMSAGARGVRGVRGEARQALLDRLRQMDRELLEAARAHTDAIDLADLDAEAGRELEPFRERLTREAYERSHRASVDRLIRERKRLPTMTYE